LGQPNVDAMLDGLTQEQLFEWMAYGQVEPFGEERADLRSAIIACVFANAHRGKGQKAFKVSDFMPKFDKKKPQTWQQMKQTFKAFAAAHNAHEARKRG